MSEEKSLITIHPRAYNLIKSATITSVAEALVEIITNADDSYQAMDPSPASFPIGISVCYDNCEDSAGCVTITDNAKGMTGEKMVRVLTVVGERVAEDFQRGFFSRGAKDVSAIGKVSFESISETGYSHLNLYPDSTFEILASDLPATPELRDRLGIPECGTRVSIQVLHAISLPSYDYFMNTFPRILQLRSIFASPKHNVTLSIKCNTRIGNPHFVTIQNPVVTITNCSGLQTGNIRSCPRFSYRIRRHDRTTIFQLSNLRGQVFLNQKFIATD